MTSNFSRFKAFYQTASLWNGKLNGLQQFSMSNLRFDHLDAQDSLELPAIPHGTVLGKRAEYFFKFCVEQSSNYEIVLSNIQIFKDRLTLGELDYLVLEKATKKLVHIELVYKFYIYDPKATYSGKNSVFQELCKYQGPNRRDNLIKKMERLKIHQLPLLYRKETQQQMQLMGLKIDIQQVVQKVCFLAHVFIPQSYWNHSFEYINKNSITGYYFKWSAFAKAETSNTYFLPEKYAWKMTPQVLESSYSFPEVYKEVRSSLERGFAPLIWMLLEDGTFERFFVIKD